MKLASFFAKSAIVTALVGGSFFILPACSSSDGEDACKRVESLCSGSSSSDAGTTSVTVKCDGEKLNDADNAGDVKKCTDDAKDCNAAVACLAQAKL
jgi:hypothetical protein